MGDGATNEAFFEVAGIHAVDGAGHGGPPFVPEFGCEVLSCGCSVVMVSSLVVWLFGCQGGCGWGVVGGGLVALWQALSYSCCLLYTSPSPRDQRGSRMPSSA